jgi:hypothetical protein
MMPLKPVVLFFIAASLLCQTTTPVQTKPFELKRTARPQERL